MSNAIHPKTIFLSFLSQGWLRQEVVGNLVDMLTDSKYHKFLSFQTHKPYENNISHCAKAFRSSACDYWLNIDSDNPCIKNPLDLVECDKDIIAFPTPITQVYEGQHHLAFNVYCEDTESPGNYIPQTPPKDKGLQKVDIVGSGCFLVKHKVIKAITQPFIRQIDEFGCATWGPDFHFCKEAKGKGFEIYAHWDYTCSHFKEINLGLLLDDSMHDKRVNYIG